MIPTSDPGNSGSEGHPADVHLPASHRETVESGGMKTKSSCSHCSSELAKHFMSFYLIFTEVLLRSFTLILQLRKPGQGRYLGRELAVGSQQSQGLSRTLLVLGMEVTRWGLGHLLPQRPPLWCALQVQV